MIDLIWRHAAWCVAFVSMWLVGGAVASGQGVVFTDVTAAAGINHIQMDPELVEVLPGEAFFAGGAAAGDFDGDGQVDLVFTRVNDNDIFYRNLGDGTFEGRTTTAGFIFPTYTNGVASGDVDNDGDLDLLVINNAAAPNLYRNDGGNANHYLRIKTEGTFSNRDGIGTWITVTPDLANPDHQLVWEIDGGSSFVSQSEHVAHFGLGPVADTVDLVRIQWPASGIVQELRNVQPDQLLSIVERHPCDFNEDGQIDAADYVEWRKTLGQTVAHATGADADGDGVIDAADYLLWQAHFGAPLGIGAGRAAAVGGHPVPEPAWWMLSVGGLLCWGRLRGCRRDK